MNNDKSPEKLAYGYAYQPLQTELARQRKFAEMRLSTYLSYRMNIEGWIFNSGDMTTQTGLERHTVNKLCKALVETNIFQIKEANRGNPTTYTFNKQLLQNYLRGNTALSGLEKILAIPGSSITTLPGSPTTTYLEVQLPRTWKSNYHVPGSPTTTTNNNKEEIEKTSKQEPCLLAYSQSPEPDDNKLNNGKLSANEKAALLKMAVDYNNSEYNMNWQMSKPVIERAKTFFKDNPDMPVSEILDTLKDCSLYAQGSTASVKGTFNKQHYVRKAADIAYLLASYDQTLLELDSLRAQFNTY